MFAWVNEEKGISNKLPYWYLKEHCFIESGHGKNRKGLLNLLSLKYLVKVIKKRLSCLIAMFVRYNKEQDISNWFITRIVLVNHGKQLVNMDSIWY